MPTYGCLTTFTSTAKRWLPILGLVLLVYIAFWTAGYSPIGWPLQTQQTRQSPDALTVAQAEASFRHPHPSREFLHQHIEFSGSVTSDAPKKPATSEKESSGAREGSPDGTRSTQTAPILFTTPKMSSSWPATSLGTRASTRLTVPPTTTASKGDGLTWNPSEGLRRGYGKVPFPVENVNSLPNAFKVVADCQRDLDYIFFVHTAATHSDHRRIMREVVANTSFGSQYSWTTVFFVGMSSVDKVSASVKKEAELYGDVAVLPYMDTYRNLTYKFVYGMKWTLDNCPRARFVLKMDDDIVLHLPTLLKKFARSAASSSASAPPPPRFHCCVWDGMPVIRQTALPWYMPKSVYPYEHFRRYCSGSAVFVESAALVPLYNASFDVPYLPIDDAYVTGELAAAANIKHEALNKVYSFNSNNWKSVVDGTLLVVHVPNAETRSNVWKLVAKALSEQWPLKTSVPSRVTQSARKVV